MEKTGAGQWRQIYGKKETDKRQRDVELVLRFFALARNSSSYKKPMKDFLSDFMKTNQTPEPMPEDVAKKRLTKFRTDFETTTELILKNLGQKPFHLTAGLNAAVFDSVSVAFARHAHQIPKDIKARYERLKKDPVFQKDISRSTTDVEAVSNRLKLAEKFLFG